MTYCVAMLVDSGLVFLSDSRTSAGVDQVSVFRKINVFERRGDRALVLLTAGNLAASQAVMNVLWKQIDSNAGTHLMNCTSLVEAAQCVGDALRAVFAHDAEALKQHGVEFNSSLILGGQIRGEAPRLFQIYAPGNFIESTIDTSYFQIGESKYGKPIIDRVVSRSTALAKVAKCALISMDSTIRSNLSVGLPLDLACIKRDGFRIESHINIDADHAYFRMVRTQWSESLRHAFHQLPDPDWI
jgi:putative proteasome-type protease